ncbi:MAG: peptidase M20 [Gemmatimonadetes bacterium]|nr:MAG: peptidase M20 [Gemmatimonadota bacterium]
MHPSIQAAIRHLERTDAVTLARQAELSALPAPTGSEGRRAARVAELFREVGLRDVFVDEVGNVHAWYGDASGEAAVVVAAHLDTAFGGDVNVRVTRRGDRLEGPGISDNARGLAALVAVADALRVAAIPLQRPVLFAATVGEEGAGDLKGMRHLFARDGLRAHAVIALDGAGLERIVHRALGSRRYRVTYRGPGGHSWAAFGVANPATAVGRAVQRLAELPLAAEPRTTCAVVRLGGGTGLNSIPQEAWLDLDLRSEDADALTRLDAAVQTALTRARDEENARRAKGTAPLTLDCRIVGDRPCGLTRADHPLVKAAVAATRALRKVPELAAASTDANVPIARRIPAIALGAGGRSGDAHLPSEWYENDEGVLGLVRAVMVVAEMAGMD